MAPKVSAITATFRPGTMLIGQFEDLIAQTLDDIEWIIVDDLLHPECPYKRGFVITGLPALPVHHIPPRNYSPHFAAASAFNSGLVHATGKLVYFLNDYIRLPPSLLQRHLDIYEAYGPKIIISGPLDPEPPSGHGESRHAERPLGDGVGEIASDELLGAWYWAGRNDSADLETTIAVNGFDERCDGAHGGQDVEYARRMVNAGCRYLFDTQVAARFLHPGTSKGGPGQKVPWNTLYDSAKAGRLLAENGWSLAEERQKVHG